MWMNAMNFPADFDKAGVKGLGCRNLSTGFWISHKEHQSMHRC